jgi:glycosyltransferase involved in cell wall biosynthesis
MKLLCVVPSYSPAFQYGGPVASVHALNKALVAQGVDVSVYTTNVGLNGAVPVNKETELDGVSVTYFSFSPCFEFLGATGWQFSRGMAECLKTNLESFDVVYIVSIWNYPSAMAARYCRKRGKPYVVSPRGLLYPETLSKKFWKKWPYYRIAARSALQSAAAIHYTSEDEAEKTHSYLALKNRALVIPNGLDLDEFRQIPQRQELGQRYPSVEGKKVILFLGRISWKKGLDILVQGLAPLLQKRDDVHLLIVGHDDEGFGRKIKAWLDKAGIVHGESPDLRETRKNEAKVTFTGMLAGRDKLAAFAGSDVFVLPSYSENFGMTVLEAMACGTPVVVTNKVGISREVAKNHAGVVVDAHP